MDPQRKAEMAVTLAHAMLRNRDEIRRFLEEARVAGSKKDIRSWEGRLRKTERLVAEYGLERYEASRPSHLR